MEGFNLIDALLVLVILLGAWAGWSKGLLLAGVQLLTLVASLLAAFYTYRWPAGWLAAQAPHLAVWWPPLSFLVIYLVVNITLGGAAFRLLGKAPSRVHANALNRLLGLVPGAANGLIHAAVITVLLLSLPVFDRLSGMARESPIATRLTAPAEWLEARLAPIFEPAVRRGLAAMTVPVGSRERVDLPFEVSSPKPRPDLEAKMLEMVNAERAKAGLPPLRADPELVQVARKHSRDMFAQGYFSHVSPDGRELSDRLRADGVRFLTAGENLALAPSLPIAHRGLMDSPGHRANILRPQFGRLGIGVLDGGRHGLMVTQNFRN